MKKKKISKASRMFYILLSYLSPGLNTRLLFLKKFGRLPDLKNPATLNEKLLKLKLEDFGRNELIRQCADKYRVRAYVESYGLERCLNKLLAVYDSAAATISSAGPRGNLTKARQRISSEHGGGSRSGRISRNCSTGALTGRLSWKNISEAGTACLRRIINFTAFMAAPIASWYAWGVKKGGPVFIFLTGSLGCFGLTATRWKRRRIFRFQSQRGLRRLWRLPTC